MLHAKMSWSHVLPLYSEWLRTPHNLRMSLFSFCIVARLIIQALNLPCSNFSNRAVQCFGASRVKHWIGRIVLQVWLVLQNRDANFLSIAPFPQIWRTDWDFANFCISFEPFCHTLYMSSLQTPTFSLLGLTLPMADCLILRLNLGCKAHVAPLVRNLNPRLLRIPYRGHTVNGVSSLTISLVGWHSWAIEFGFCGILTQVLLGLEMCWELDYLPIQSVTGWLNLEGGTCGEDGRGWWYSTTVELMTNIDYLLWGTIHA